MAISKLARVDNSRDYELHDPNDASKKLGVVFQIRSINNPDAKRVMKLETGKLAMKTRGANDQIDQDALVGLIVSQSFDPSPEALATCITGWNWGDEEFEDGGGALEFTPANVARVLALDWIADQVRDEAYQVANFTKA
jgi:hypothetical protein